MDFKDKLLGIDRLDTLMNEGCEDPNKATALKYILEELRMKGLGDGLDNKISVEFMGIDSFIDSHSQSDWEEFTESNKKSEGREEIDKMIYGIDPSGSVIDENIDLDTNQEIGLEKKEKENEE